MILVSCITCFIFILPFNSFALADVNKFKITGDLCGKTFYEFCVKTDFYTVLNQHVSKPELLDFKHAVKRSGGLTYRFVNEDWMWILTHTAKDLKNDFDNLYNGDAISTKHEITKLVFNPKNDTFDLLPKLKDQIKKKYKPTLEKQLPRYKIKTIKLTITKNSNYNETLAIKRSISRMKVPERVTRIAACGFFLAASTEILGFTKMGVRAGSTAARYQSFAAKKLGKQIVKNSHFARLQSLGARGVATLSAARLAMFCGVDIEDLENIWGKLVDVYQGSRVEKFYDDRLKGVVDGSIKFVNDTENMVLEKLVEIDLPEKVGIVKNETVRIAGKVGDGAVMIGKDGFEIAGKVGSKAVEIVEDVGDETVKISSKVGKGVAKGGWYSFKKSIGTRWRDWGRNNEFGSGWKRRIYFQKMVWITKFGKYQIK